MTRAAMMKVILISGAGTMALLIANPYTASFTIDLGDRVELHPATDAWLNGDRYGEVTKIGRKFIHVRMDRSRLTRRMSFEQIARRIGESGARAREI